MLSRITTKRSFYAAIGLMSGTTLYYAFKRPHQPAQPVSLEFLYDENGNLKPPTFPPEIQRAGQIARLKASGKGASTVQSLDSSRNGITQKSVDKTSNIMRGVYESGKEDTEAFDILVIGAGATGAGIALDAASRGLKVGLVDRDDFASGTSSKSTKLVHGGVRYLEKAVWKLDYQQYVLRFV
jgi:glycerol-3-phosphate dehydrogenase